MKADDLSKNITVGEGRPARTRGNYDDIYPQLSPGKFVQVASKDDIKRVMSSLNWHIKSNNLPWRVVTRSRELRLYIVDAEEA